MKSSIIWSVLHGLMPTQKRLQTQANTAQADTQHPPDDDKEAWRKYWEERGQPWRREPEIDKSRQQELAQQRKKPPHDWKSLKQPFARIANWRMPFKHKR